MGFRADRVRWAASLSVNGDRIHRSSRDAAPTVRGKAGRRRRGADKIRTPSQTARDFWEYLKAKPR